MKQEELLKEIMQFFPELISLWSQKSEKERLNLIIEKHKYFKQKLEKTIKSN